MRNKKGDQEQPPRRSPGPDEVLALLAATGLRAEGVERCPDPNCPVCSGGRRAAA